jgi:hypothetical protein
VQFRGLEQSQTEKIKNKIKNDMFKKVDKVQEMMRNHPSSCCLEYQVSPKSLGQ